jgi:hypothetical protein
MSRVDRETDKQTWRNVEENLFSIFHVQAPEITDNI